jgi:hypothetical protein
MRCLFFVVGLCLTVAGCFRDSPASGCANGSEGCFCKAENACDGALVCRDGYCIEPQCTPGVRNCSCDDQGACQPGLMCVDGAICHELESTSTAAEASAAETSMSTTTVTASTTDAETTRGPDTTDGPGTTHGTSSTTGPTSETGTVSGCLEEGDCPQDLYCDFLDNLCGMGEPGVCIIRPNQTRCTPDLIAVCGCNGKQYDGHCSAAADGVDVGPDMATCAG